MKKETRTIYICDTCGLVSNNEDEMKVHEAKHTHVWLVRLIYKQEPLNPYFSQDVVTEWEETKEVPKAFNPNVLYTGFEDGKMVLIMYAKAHNEKEALDLFTTAVSDRVKSITGAIGACFSRIYDRYKKEEE